MIIRASEPPMKERRAAAARTDNGIPVSVINTHKYVYFMPYGMSIKFRRICKNLLGLAILARMITRAQCRAARALLEWNQQDLARQARVGIVTVHQFESGV